MVEEQKLPEPVVPKEVLKPEAVTTTPSVVEIPKPAEEKKIATSEEEKSD